MTAVHPAPHRDGTSAAASKRLVPRDMHGQP